MIWVSCKLNISTFILSYMTPDRKSTRLNSSHANISYAVFCLKKKKNKSELQSRQYHVCHLLLANPYLTTLTRASLYTSVMQREQSPQRRHSQRAGPDRHCTQP